MAVDASGNVFVADYGNSAVKEIVAVNGVVSSTSQVNPVGSGFSYPTSVAVDASGNVFVADYGNSAVKEIVAVNGVVSSTSQVNPVGSGFSGPYGVAVDASGNVFVADDANSAVKEIVAVNGVVSSTSQVNPVGSGFSYPYGVAVDASGNVFVADDRNSAVKEIVAVNGVVSSTSQVNPVGSGFSYPTSVAVDASGNVFVADFYNSAVKEIVAVNGVVSSTSQVNPLGSGFSYPYGVAVDASGNVFVADYGNSAVTEIDWAHPPSLIFAPTSVGSTSSDSPQTVTVANIGNAALTFPVPASGNNPSIASNFSLDSSGSTACPLVTSGSSAGTLPAGASCTLPISFAPTAVGNNINGSLILTDDNLNVGPLNNPPSPNYATQSIGLSGTATAPPAVVPTVTTAAITSITQTTASGGGNVTSDGGASVTARGVCWSTSANPSTADTCTTDGSGTGAFTSAITGLTASMGYYVRAYAINSVGTAYGNDVSFTTLAPVGGADFLIGTGSGGSYSATVTAGSSAVYSLLITPANGFTGTVSLACSGLPSGASCSPGQLSVSGSSAVPFTVTIATTARTTTTAGITDSPVFPGRASMLVTSFAFALVLGSVMIGAGAQRRRRFALVTLALVIVVAIGFVACGGSNHATTPTGTTGTPVGTYPVVLTTTSGSLSHTTKLTLTVN